MFFIRNLLANWKTYYNSSNKKKKLIISLLSITVILFAFTNFLAYIENRIGVVINDPILGLFKPINFSIFIFVLIYLSLVISIIYLINKPKELLIGIIAYSIMVCFRMIAMFLLALEPPPTMIPLIDPFVEIFSTGTTLTKDLFFSGHTATMLLFIFTIYNRVIKTVLLSFLLLIIVFILLQHVHYSIDVFVAFFVSYCSYRIALKIEND